jgi:vacuolar-type H+-ATPase subunit E/Vma4
MGLHAIIEAVRLAGQDQVRQIEAGASLQAREILANADLEAQEIGENACAEAFAPAVQERARILHRARLEGLRITGDVREALVDAALDQARGRLAGLREGPGYQEVLLHLTQEALAELSESLESGNQVHLQADPRDREVLLNQVLIDLWLDVPVSFDLNCWGGLIARSEDGRVVVINTLEARLARATPYLRRYLAALFEQAHFEIQPAHWHSPVGA